MAVDFLVEAIGGDVFMRSLAVLDPGSSRIISAQDPTQLGEVRAQDICAD